MTAIKYCPQTKLDKTKQTKSLLQTEKRLKYLEKIAKEFSETVWKEKENHE